MTTQPIDEAPSPAERASAPEDPAAELPALTRSRDRIVVQGARTHNLKSLSLSLPKRKLVVFTGPSGSGKSSLAFDTIYAEGRRRYVESLSTYARQFLGQMDRPDVDLLMGLSPTISIEQKTTSNNPRSTVGTITEIYDHMRVLWSKLGEQRCHECGNPVTNLSPDRIVEQLQALPEGTRFMLLAPQVRNRKGEFRDLFDQMRKKGYARARIDGEIVELDTIEKLAKSYKHDIDIVIDRLVARPKAAARIEESTRLALRLGEGGCIVLIVDEGGERERLYSTERTCVECDIAFPELTHQSFSFNSPVGMCDRCKGLGMLEQIDPELLVVHPEHTILEGAIEGIGPDPSTEEGGDFKHKKEVKKTWARLKKMALDREIALDVPWQDLPKKQQNYVMYGSTRGRRKYPRGYKGVVHYLEAALDDARKQATRGFFEEFQTRATCPDCEGGRLRPESQAVVFEGASITALCQRSLDRVRAFFADVELEGDAKLIGGELVQEIHDRLKFLENVGLQYLNVHRASDTLSGGESQRIRLASQLGSELSGILYVLDEPSIGLHQRDNRQLLATLEGLRDRGNSVIVVEHDRDTMEVADHIVDFGPGAGRAGGEVVASGDLAAICEAEDTVTGDYLAGRRHIELPAARRAPGEQELVVRGAAAHNLKGIDVRIPKGCFVCVTGVSGAGKSTLVNDIIYPAVARHVYFKHRTVGAHEALEGLDIFDKVIEIDQRPIGRTPRSNPATYTKVFESHPRAVRQHARVAHVRLRQGAL